ncbi:hypothetical protein [Alloprevotella tannerae]
MSWRYFAGDVRRDADVVHISLRILLSEASALTWRREGLAWWVCARDKKGLRS